MLVLVRGRLSEVVELLVGVLAALALLLLIEVDKRRILEILLVWALELRLVGVIEGDEVLLMVGVLLVLGLD